MNWDNPSGGARPFWAFQGLRRRPDRGRISGVCAGIAAHWGIRLKWVRIVAIISLIFAPMLTLIAYGLATFFLQPAESEPVKTAGAADDGKATPYELPPDLSFPALRRKFREIEERAGAMETQVTSQEFHLRRDFRRMGKA